MRRYRNVAGEVCTATIACEAARMSIALDAVPHHQRARGRAALRFAAGPAGARLQMLDQSAPLRVLFPDNDPDEPSTAALVNVAGGLAGGDSAAFALTLEAGTRFSMTSAAAEKIYRSLGPETEIATSLHLAEETVCEWLPQETIVFDGARLRRRIDFALAPTARLIAAEMLVLGRAARGEVLTHGAVQDAWRLRRDGRLVWADTLRLTDPAAARASRFGLDGAGALATLVLAMPEAAAHRALARDLADGGASLVAPGLLLARWQGEASAVRAALGAALMALRAAAFGHPARLPRLWRT
jgi:urease accessory protein